MANLHQIRRIENQLTIRNEIAVFSDASRAFHRLAFPTNEILIEIGIHVRNVFNVRKRSINEVVVLIRNVLGAKDFGFT